MKKKQKMKKRKEKIAIQYEVLKWLFAPCPDVLNQKIKLDLKPNVIQKLKKI